MLTQLLAKIILSLQNAETIKALEEMLKPIEVIVCETVTDKNGDKSRKEKGRFTIDIAHRLLQAGFIVILAYAIEQCKVEARQWWNRDKKSVADWKPTLSSMRVRITNKLVELCAVERAQKRAMASALIGAGVSPNLGGYEMDAEEMEILMAAPYNLKKEQCEKFLVVRVPEPTPAEAMAEAAEAEETEAETLQA